MIGKFEDGRPFSAGTEIETDVCILGAGAAGITIARELAGSGLRVCLLDAGGLIFDPDIQDASPVQSVGRDYDVWLQRLRYFGGSTNHWGGHCTPLEPEDFEAKDWIPHSGWPIAYAEIEDYYRRAHGVLRLGEFGITPDRVAADLNLPLIRWPSRAVRTQLSQYNDLRMGLAYEEDLAAADNVRVILYADGSAFRLDEASSRSVSALEVDSPSGNRFTVRARHFILAGGGIENARLLLLSNRERPAGLGNRSDALGRYFMEHLWYPSGTLLPFDPGNVPRLYSENVPYRDITVRCHLILSAEASAEARIGRFRSELVARSRIDDSMASLQRGSFGPGDLVRVAASPVGLGNALSCPGEGRRDYIRLRNYVEQVPNPDSRVTLGDARDVYGRPQTVLDWRLTEMDHRTVLAAHRVMATEAGIHDFGRMHIQIKDSPEIYLQGVAGGAHHIGTTRMSARPQDGVVDTDCRVHDTDNLFVAGSSVFPTGGYANPTLTIVAMSLRLADHVKRLYA